MNDSDPTNYFFQQGLRFTCTQCGQCCTGAPGTIRVDEAEIDALASLCGQSRTEFATANLRPLELGGWSIRERSDGSCVFFADNKCTVYEARPAQCRTYPFWLKNLRSAEAWQQAARACPGIGAGRSYTRAEILGIVDRSPV